MAMRVFAMIWIGVPQADIQPWRGGPARVDSFGAGGQSLQKNCEVEEGHLTHDHIEGGL
jgi:hypothetical protein